MSMEAKGLPKLDNVIFGEIQVLLAEKRTALASLRTGIAVFFAFICPECPYCDIALLHLR